MPKVTVAKKQVLVRVPEQQYEELLLLSTQETLKRGAPVSVPALINEQIDRWLKEIKGSSNG